MDEQDEQLHRDDIFDALSDVNRRIILRSLPHYPTASDGKPAEVTVENDVAMRSTHLPTLAHVGLINWDKSTRTVTKGPHLEEAEELFTFRHKNEDSSDEPREVKYA